MATTILPQPQAFVKRGIIISRDGEAVPNANAFSERVYEPEGEAMFQDQIAVAIDAARGGRALDDISRTIWRGLSEGWIGDDEAQRLAERLHTRRTLNATAAAGAPQRRAGSTGRPSIFGPPRCPQRPPVRSQAVERRRRIAASGAMPPAIAARFTTAEIAVLSVVASDVKQKGRCDQCIDEIAARAGCSRSSAKNAIRTAARLGFIRVTHRPRRGQKHLPNLIEVMSQEWQTWIKRGPARSLDRGQTSDPHGYKNQEAYEKKGVSLAMDNPRCIRTEKVSRHFTRNR